MISEGLIKDQRLDAKEIEFQMRRYDSYYKFKTSSPKSIRLFQDIPVLSSMNCAVSKNYCTHKMGFSPHIVRWGIRKCTQKNQHLVHFSVCTSVAKLFIEMFYNLGSQFCRVFQNNYQLSSMCGSGPVLSVKNSVSPNFGKEDCLDTTKSCISLKVSILQMRSHNKLHSSNNNLSTFRRSIYLRNQFNNDPFINLYIHVYISNQFILLVKYMIIERIIFY